MNRTPNLGLKKPGQEDFYNVDDFNYNAEIIDEEVAKKVNQEELDNLTPAQIGAETPEGAQQKANQAEQNAKNYADIKVAEGSTILDPTTQKRYKWGIEDGLLYVEEVV